MYFIPGFTNNHYLAHNILMMINDVIAILSCERERINIRQRLVQEIDELILPSRVTFTHEAIINNNNKRLLFQNILCFCFAIFPTRRRRSDALAYYNIYPMLINSEVAAKLHYIYVIYSIINFRRAILMVRPDILYTDSELLKTSPTCTHACVCVCVCKIRIDRLYYIIN